MAVNPATLAIAGAGIGAMMDRDKPLRGAMIGGLGGFAGGTALGGVTGANNAALGAMASGTPAGVGINNAAMLSNIGQGALAPASFTSPALGVEALNTALPMTSEMAAVGTQSGSMMPVLNAAQGYDIGMAQEMLNKAQGLADKLPAADSDAMKTMKAGQMMMNQGQPQQRQPMIAPTPMIRPPQGQINPVRPYDDEDYGFTTPYPSRLPSFGGF